MPPRSRSSAPTSTAISCSGAARPSRYSVTPPRRWWANAPGWCRPNRRPNRSALFERCLTGEAIRDVEVKRKRKDGSIVDIRLAATPMYNPDGKAWGVAWAYDDITGRKKAERQLNQIAHHDQLTGLPNRVSLKSELTSLLDARRRPLAFRRAVRSRRLQGRERHRRPFDRRRAAGGGGETPESCRRRQPAESTGSAATSSSSSSPAAAIPSASPSSSSRCCSSWRSRSRSMSTCFISAAAPASRSRRGTAHRSTS